MATSTITLYRDSLITPEKNWIVEDIATYLATLVYLAPVSDFQYIKHSLNLSIKLNKSQLFLDTNSILDYDYISIKNSNEIRTYYYFITNKLWRSESTIELILVMDVLNTFQWNTDYVVNKRTLVMREHKDRVKLLDGSSLSSPAFERIVDLRSEEIYPTLYKTDEYTIIDKLDTTWTLYYKNANAIDPTDFNQVNPVDCFLMPKTETEVYYAQTEKVINASDLPDHGVYPSDMGWLFNPYIQQVIIEGSDGTRMYSSISSSITPWLNFYGIFLQRQDATHIAMALVHYYVGLDGNLHYTIKQTIQNLTYVKFINSPSTIKYRICDGSLPSDEDELYSDDETNFTWDEIDWSSQQTSSFIDDSFINRTDSQSIKIIDLPYCPTDYEIDVNNRISFSPIWEIKTTDKCLKLKESNISFEHSMMMNSSLNPMDVMVIDWTSEPDEKPNSSRLRKDYMESKIYHSDYYQPKFVYDSFTFQFKMENLDFESYWNLMKLYEEFDGLGFPINFVMTRNIVSKFLFSFPSYITKYSTEDYDNVVVISRNNEEVLYTSQYIDYLKTGYNYDLKAKQRNEIAGGVGIGLSAISTLAGIVASVATSNPLGIVGSVVGGGISIANQSINYAKSVAQSEQSIEQKLVNLKNQSVSVQNADDIDLLNYYSGNRAKMCFYQVSPTMKQALLDMFYYSGYATQEHKIPTINSRYWFNYLQCELFIDTTSNLPKDIEDQIKMKFKDGCTFFHHHTTWDLSQVKENYESWILA